MAHTAWQISRKKNPYFCFHIKFPRVEDIKMEENKMDVTETEKIDNEGTTAKELRMVRRSGRRSKGNNSL